MGDAATVADLEFRETEAQPPGGCPLHPAGRQLSLQRLHVVLLLQAVADRAEDGSELQADGLSEAIALDVPSGGDAPVRIEELQLVADGLCSPADRVTAH